MSDAKKPVAFYWSERYGKRYCVVILDRSKREWVRVNGERQWRVWVREYHANTVRELRRMARPYVLGRHVVQNCLAHIHNR